MPFRGFWLALGYSSLFLSASLLLLFDSADRQQGHLPVHYHPTTDVYPRFRFDTVVQPPATDDVLHLALPYVTLHLAVIHTISNSANSLVRTIMHQKGNEVQPDSEQLESRSRRVGVASEESYSYYIERWD